MIKPLFIKIKTVPNWDYATLYPEPETEIEKAELSKRLAITPETCKVIGLAAAIGDGPVKTIVHKVDVDNEAEILAKFWQATVTQNGSPVPQKRLLIGFNLLKYDLPCLITRSMMLGVDNSIRGPIDFKPWGYDVKDLFYLRQQMSPYGSEHMRGLHWLADVHNFDMVRPFDNGLPDGADIENVWSEIPTIISDVLANELEYIRRYYDLTAGYTHTKDW